MDFYTNVEDKVRMVVNDSAVGIKALLLEICLAFKLVGKVPIKSIFKILDSVV